MSTCSQGSKPAVKPKTTGIEIADYDLFGLEESGEVVTYSDDSAEEEAKADEEEDGSDDGSGGEPPKKDGDPKEGAGEDVWTNPESLIMFKRVQSTSNQVIPAKIFPTA